MNTGSRCYLDEPARFLRAHTPVRAVLAPDHTFQLLDPKLIRYVVNHYESTGMGVMLKRRSDDDFRRRRKALPAD
jgi:hypothetical protein